MTKEDELKIIQAYLSGQKVLDITKEYKISSATVSKILKKHSITSRYKNSGNIKKEIYEAIALGSISKSILSLKYNITEKEVNQYFIEERNKRIIKDYNNGIKITEICKKYNLSNMSIYKILDKNKIKRKAAHNVAKKEYAVISDLDEGQIIKDYQIKNLKLSEILSKYNINKNQLYIILYKHHIPFRNKTTISDDIKFKVRTDFNAGLNITQLSVKYNLSRNLISMLIKEDYNE